MSYTTTATMARDGYLHERFTAAAATLDLDGTDPHTWVMANIWALISHGNIAGDYAYAEDAKTINVNPNTGQRDDVINDAAILAAVTAVHGA